MGEFSDPGFASQPISSSRLSVPGDGSCSLSDKGDPFWEQVMQRGLFNTTFLQVFADGDHWELGSL